MMILIDHTEARTGTRLPQEVIGAAQVIVGLEHLTGCDLILSPLSGPKVKDLTPPGVWALKQHCQAGLVVQRKSGRDFLSSIPKLPEIQLRMQEWGLGWLLVTGELKCGSKGQAVLNGKGSSFSYWAVIGALDAWQLRGGGVTVLARDGLIGKWLNDMAKRLVECQEPRLVLAKKSKQGLVRESQLAQTVETLMTLPGVGAQTALNIAQQCGGLRASLELLSDPDVLKRKDKPIGVGEKLVAEFRRIMDLKEGEGLK